MGGELRPISLLPASNLHSSPDSHTATTEAIFQDNLGKAALQR